MDAEIVKMSSKGQLVVPRDIRDEMGLMPSDRFISFPVKDGVVFKKVRMPNAKEEFNSLAKDIRKQFKSKGITPKDVDEAIKWARKG